MNSSDSTDNTKIKSFPNLVRKEALAALLALALLAIVSAVLDAPVSGPADPSGVPDAEVKAPWIFVGIQQTLRHFPPFFAGVILPFAAILMLALIPYCGDKNRKSVFLIFFSIVLASLVLTLWGYFW
jgi:quinol-cytochrome oxidoreductase complex cytochrome b subunit